MNAKVDFQGIIQLTLREVGAAPRRSLIFLALAAIAWAATDVVAWSSGPGLSPVDWVAAAAAVCCGAVFIYVAVMAMAGSEASALGFARYVLTWLVLFVPLAAVGVVSVLLLRAGFGAMAFAVMVLVLPASMVPALLVGWPVWQAASMRWVGPFEAWRSTKGCRLPLFAVALAMAGITRAAPGVAGVNDWAAVILVAAFGGLIGFVMSLIAAATAVVAARQMQAEPKN